MRSTVKPLSYLLIVGVLLLSACGGHRENEVAETEFGKFPGTWKLISRIDRDEKDSLRIEPSLGKDPVVILMYDSLGNMSVQAMKRTRSENLPGDTSTSQAQNNSNTFSGYDAYFGSYRVDKEKEEIVHQIEGALYPGDIGKQLHRNYVFSGDTLRLSFLTANATVPVIRTLTFIRQGKRVKAK